MGLNCRSYRRGIRIEGNCRFFPNNIRLMKDANWTIARPIDKARAAEFRADPFASPVPEHSVELGLGRHRLH